MPSSREFQTLAPQLDHAFEYFNLASYFATLFYPLSQNNETLYELADKAVNYMRTLTDSVACYSEITNEDREGLAFVFRAHIDAHDVAVVVGQIKDNDGVIVGIEAEDIKTGRSSNTRLTCTKNTYKWTHELSLIVNDVEVPAIIYTEARLQKNVFKLGKPRWKISSSIRLNTGLFPGDDLSQSLFEEQVGVMVEERAEREIKSGVLKGRSG